MQDAWPGTLIGGKYRIEQVLRETRSCLVAAARHRHLGIPVAIKLLLGDAAESPDSVARFLREGQLASLLRSEHVVRILDVGIEDEGGVPYIAMEFLEGHDFAHHISSSGGMPLETAAGWLIDACEAIVEAHAIGIIHRDIKPSNLFVTRGADGSPVVKVLDFGIASATMTPSDARMTSTADIMGTPLYMSPEVLESARRADVRSDVWALGVTLYEMLAARVPFPGESMVEVYASIGKGILPPLQVLRPEVPAEVSELVLRCLAREPAARFQHVTDLVDVLANAALPPAEAAVRVSRVRRIAAEAAGRRTYAHAIVEAVGTIADTCIPTARKAPFKAFRSRKAALVAAAVAGAFVAGSVGFALLSGPAPSGSAVPAAARSEAPARAETPVEALNSQIVVASSTPSASWPEAAIPDAAPGAPASARSRTRPWGPPAPRVPRESDFATDPHR